MSARVITFKSSEREDIDAEILDRDRERELRRIASRELDRLDKDRWLSGEINTRLTDEETD